jgi:hypothetical protein
VRERVIDRSVHQVNEFSSAANFLAQDSIPAGITTIWERGLPIDLLISPAASSTTLFFFHGAIEPHFTLPVLSGLGISGGLDANRVFVSDPSLILDKTLMLAWYAGNHIQPDLQTLLTEIFRKVANAFNSNSVIFFGGSGGGFASLYFASQFENSLALVFNPQTNIARYSQRAVYDFVEKAFGMPPNADNPLPLLPVDVVTDICETYQVPRNTTVAYMQNRNDSNHVRSHLAPFAQAIHPDTKFLVLQEPWKDGHSPPPKPLLTRALDLAVTSRGWYQDFKDFGFEEGSRPEKLD